MKLDVKRLHLPIVLTHTCTTCKSTITKDLSNQDYLSYPTLDKPFRQHFYCHECDVEDRVELLLTLSLSVLESEGHTEVHNKTEETQ